MLAHWLLGCGFVCTFCVCYVRAWVQEHCSEAIQALQRISQHWSEQMLTLTLMESNAEVLAAGAVSWVCKHTEREQRKLLGKPAHGPSCNVLRSVALHCSSLQDAAAGRMRGQA